MPYTPPVTFVPNTTIDASDFSENHEAARIFVHQDIESSDLGSDINTENIAVGEFNPIDNSFIFETGQHDGFNKIAKELPLSERSYHSGTIKVENMFSDERFVSIPNLSRSIYFPTDGFAIVSFNIHTRDYFDGDTDSRAYVTGDSSLSASIVNNSNIKLAIDGNITSIERWYAFSEESDENIYLISPAALQPTSNSVASGLRVGIAQNMRRFISGQIMVGDTVGGELSKGWHTFQLVVDSRNEIGTIIQATFNVETFSFNGFDPATSGNLQYQFKISRDNF